MKKKFMLGAAALLAMTTLSLTSCGGGGGNDAISSMKKVNDKMDQMIKEVEKLTEESQKAFEKINNNDNLEFTDAQEDSIENRYKLFEQQYDDLRGALHDLRSVENDYREMI